MMTYWKTIFKAHHRRQVRCMAARWILACLTLVFLGGCGVVFGVSEEFMIERVAGLADGSVFYSGSSYQSPDRLGIKRPDGKDVRFSDNFPGCGRYSVYDLVPVGNGAKVLLGCDDFPLVVGDLAVDGQFGIVARIPEITKDGPLKLSASGDVYFREWGCGAISRISAGGSREVLASSSMRADGSKWTPKPSEASCGSPVIGWQPTPVRGSDLLAFAYADSIILVDTAGGELVARMPEFATSDVWDIELVPGSAEHAIVVSATTSGKRGLFLLSPEDGGVKLLKLGNFGDVAVTENGKEVLTVCNWCDNRYTRVAL